MILRSAPASPFGRMVKLAAHVLGLMDQITVEHSDTTDPDDTIRLQNPLGKIPALITDSRVIYDSRVILEYFDHLGGGGTIIPQDPEDRMDCLIRNARNIGIMDAALLVVYEGRYRPDEMRVESFVEHQRDKIRRALDQIATESIEYTNDDMPDISQIGLACVLDYLDFRKPINWRDHCPHHVGFMQSFAAAVPGYRVTLPPGLDPSTLR